MAYPVIEDVITGTSSGGTISITMPDNLAADELILIYINTWEAYVHDTPSSTSGNFTRLASYTDAYSDRQVAIIYGIAYSGTVNNYLTVTLSSGTYGAAFVVYRISGHGVYATSDLNHDGVGSVYCTYTTYPVLGLVAPTPEGSIYIASISYTYTIIDMEEPTYLYSLDAYQNWNPSSITTASIEWPYTFSLLETLWNHTQTTSSRTYVTTIVRVKPGIRGTTPDVNGFGIYVPRDSIGLP